jgi:phosphoenolpyruvate carboxykinase (GTP)
LSWVIDRCEGRAAAKETPIGYVPHAEDIDLSGLVLSDGALKQLMDVDAAAWHVEIDDIGKYLEGYGTRTPEKLREKQQAVKRALG